MTSAPALPRSFHRVRLELAREPGSPEGRHDFGYDFVAPLQPEGHIDPEDWKAHRDACRVVRFRPDEDRRLGRLVRRPGGSWAFRYTDMDDEAGHHFEDERFQLGEYVSVREDDAEHTFKVVTVQAI